MTQMNPTQVYHGYGLPGHFAVSPVETELMYNPFLQQETSITVPPAPDPLPVGDYTFEFLASGITYTVTRTLAAPEAAADFRTGLAGDFNSDPGVSHLYTAAVVGNDVVLTARDSDAVFAVPTITQPGGSLITVAVTQQSGGVLLAAGLLYAYGPVVTGTGGVTPTPRGGRAARPLGPADTADTIRGIIGREVNRMELSPDFIDDNTLDSYRPGAVFPGANRHEVIAICSTKMTVNDPVFAVRNAGVYNLVGSIANVADGANTVDISLGADPLARVIAPSNTVRLGNLSLELCLIKMNRTQ